MFSVFVYARLVFSSYHDRYIGLPRLTEVPVVELFKYGNIDFELVEGGFRSLLCSHFFFISLVSFAGTRNSALYDKKFEASMIEGGR